MLKVAGYSSSRIEREEDGSWIALDKVKASFDGMLPPDNPMTTPLMDVPEDRLEAIRADFEKELAERATDEGVWDDKSVFYTYAAK